jgi:integrase/recombinase XerC
MRRILRWLWEEHGAKKLDTQVRRYPTIRPRSVTVERAHLEDVLYVVPIHVRLWLLLCSDLAIRSGTAAGLGPRHYNRDTSSLQFTTKKQAQVHLPVTEEIQALIQQCDLNLDVPFVRQLWQATTGPAMNKLTSVFNTTMSLRATMRRSIAAAGMPHTFIPHDLRRTTAVAMLEHTHDIRDVQAILGHSSLQSTIWYLDHDLRPIKRSTLELLKKPTWRKEKSA